MSRTPNTTPTADDRFREIHEQFNCPEPSCGDGATVIYQPNVVIDYRTQAFDRIRIVSAICPDCGRAWRAEFILRGGVWAIYRPVKLVTFPSQIAGIKNRLAKKNDRQLAESA